MKTKLQEKREFYNLSLKALSELSGISIYTLRSYENKQRNIKNANIEILTSLSSVLRCNPEDLI